MFTRIRTNGSIWLIDEASKRYCRFPLDEDVRRDRDGNPRPEWSDERAGDLQDAVWHDYEGDWGILGRNLFIGYEIYTQDGDTMIRAQVGAPNPVVLEGELRLIERP